MKRPYIFAALLVAAPVAFAQSGMKGMDMKDGDMGSMHKKQEKKPAQDTHGHAHEANGVVTKVDAAAGSVTIRHDPIQSLNWPAMTMAFKAKDKKLLEKLKPGAKVQFEFEQQGKDYVITSIR